MSSNKGLHDLDDLLAELEYLEDPRSSSKVKLPNSPNSTSNVSSISSASIPSSSASSSSSSSSVPINDSSKSSLPPQINSVNEIPSATRSLRNSQRNSTISRKPPVSSSSNICASCGGLIDDEHIIAMGKMWHLAHFTCNQCGSQLSGDFYEINDQHLCPPCARNSFKCSRCGNPIEGEYFRTSIGENLHPHCIVRNSCSKCGKLIVGTEVSAKDRFYHLECFKCEGCGIGLQNTFYLKGTSIYCADCTKKGTSNTSSSTYCYVCSKPINGEYVSFNGNNYHKGCFTCSKCRVPLSHEEFYMTQGMACCKKCAATKSQG